MWKLVSAYCGNDVLRKAAIALLTAFPTLVQAQIDFNAINTPVEKLDIEAATGELACLLEFIEQSPAMTDSEKKVWTSRIENPYPGARVPVESATVEWLYSALASEPLRKQDGYWSFAYRAFQALRILDLPNDEPLVAAARAILAMEFPVSVEYIPHETLVEVCFDELIKSGDPESLALVRSAETTEFWAERTQNARLSNPSAYLAGEPDALLSTLRSKAPAAILRHRHEDAAKWVEEILGRVNEPPGYRKLVKGLAEYYSSASVEQRKLNKKIP